MRLRPAALAHWMLLLLLAGCAGGTGPAAPGLPTSPPVALNVYQIHTQAAATGAALATVTAFAQLPVATPTATPYTGLDFSQARLAGVAVTASNAFVVMIHLPGLQDDYGEFRGRTGVGDFLCQRDPAYPETLFCTGPSHAGLNLVTFSLMPIAEEVDLFIVRVAVPAGAPPSSGSSAARRTDESALAYYQRNNYCEVESLYQPDRPELAWFQDSSLAGCYAITCARYDRSGTCGTANTCVQMPESPCP